MGRSGKEVKEAEIDEGRDSSSDGEEDVMADVDRPDDDGALEEGVVSPVTEADGFSALEDADLQIALAEIRRRSDENGGYVTYDEINDMLPQDLVDLVEAEGTFDILGQLGVRIIREEDVSAWVAEKEGRTRQEPDRADDPLRLYMRQMGDLDMIPPRGGTPDFRGDRRERGCVSKDLQWFRLRAEDVCAGSRRAGGTVRPV